MGRDELTKTIVLSDFDGTIVNVDTAEIALDLFADPDWRRIDEALEKGEVSFEESLRREFAMIKVSQERILSELDRIVVLRPHFQQLVDCCRSKEIPLTIVSGGLDFCIQHFLNRDDWLKYIQILAPKSQRTGNGYSVTFPKLFIGSSVNFKDDLVRHEKMNGKRVLYVGNGFGDYVAARESDLAFAIKGSRLAELCRIGNVRHDEIDDFQQVIDVLNRQPLRNS
jgi:2-hydroxy-3-keto-5-methylthiopentenyl-1-phosphate phosphatase